MIIREAHSSHRYILIKNMQAGEVSGLRGPSPCYAEVGIRIQIPVAHGKNQVWPYQLAPRQEDCQSLPMARLAPNLVRKRARERKVGEEGRERGRERERDLS